MKANSKTVVHNAASDDPYDSKKYQYFSLCLLMTAYVFNFIDRQILSILQEPIKEELLLSDTQLGLLTGFAFAVFYVVMGLPIARWADRGNRRNIVSLAVGIWSLFTALSGLVTGFFQLLLVRIGVGVGEAGCSPPSHSIISDIFSRYERATAIGLYTVGVNIGVLLGFLAGGWLNEFFGWRVAFFAVGIPGVILAICIRVFLHEPKRGRTEPETMQETGAPAPSLGFVFNKLWRLKTFRHMGAAAAFIAFAGYGLLNWLPSFFIRVHDLSTATVGTWFALILGVGGGLGTWFVGYFSDRFGRRDERWYLWITAISIAVYLPFLIGIFLVDNPTLGLMCYIIPGIFLTTYLPPIIAVTHNLVPNRMRALSSAIVYLILNLIGLGLGPLSIGFISDLLTPSLGNDGLRYAMLITIPIAAIMGIVHLLLAAKSIRKDIADQGEAI
ncbi:sugar phosphate permease [Spongiibacter sp. IMCC21906]|uniref:spinster family MFS transporter n=1 Tax=Spongiibacter sp. IMCC21906 TaxID=1620392 RepID=UPI00062DDB38|nr:MFS transporter [Spongiibacter sp. IMCC21906]AKH68244.1 sugar phosphate permease [Spongiibacter sp. IMCC21906]